MRKIKLSIVTICKNNLSGLKKTVESVKKQKSSDYEHIIVDGDSDKETKEYLKTLSDDRYVVISEPDKGISDAFNKGIELSKGQYLLFLNTGDTFVSENTLDVVCNKCKLNNQIEVFCARLGKKVLFGDIDETEFDEIWKTALIPHQSTFVKREVFEEIGGFDTSLKLRMDYDFFYRCVQKNKTYRYHPELIVNYSAGGACSENPEWFWVEGASVASKYDQNIISNKYEQWIAVSNIEISGNIIYFVIPADIDATVYIAMLHEAIQKRYGKNICYVIEEQYAFALDMYGIMNYQISKAHLNVEYCSLMTMYCKRPTVGNLFVASFEYYAGLSYRKPKRKTYSYISKMIEFLDLDRESTLLQPVMVPEMSEELEERFDEEYLKEYKVIFTEVSDLFIRKILNDYMFCGSEMHSMLKTLFFIESQNKIILNEDNTSFNISLSDMVSLAIKCGKAKIGMSGVAFLLMPFVCDLSILYIDKDNETFYGTDTLLPENVKKEKCNWCGELEEKGISKCAIYGAGVLGKYLKEIYTQNGIDVAYMIDKDYEIYSYDVPVLPLQKEMPETEMIIVAVINQGRDLIQNIKKQTGIETVYYSDILRMEKMGEL